ncbi:MAG: DUF4270 family protein, partial [Alistipes sp.]|nr:DUF4270 family protein [Alistipes sp.]
MNKTNRSWGIAVAITLLVALGACSKVNNEFGDEFIPDDQKMQVFMDTIYGINTYLTESDSFPTSGMTYGFMGSCVDPTFGHTEASFCSQYMLSYFTSEEEMFGIAPVFDSLELSFTLNAAFWGDTTQKQTFQIFEMKDRLYYDTVYYADIDLPHMIEAEPIAEFTLSGCPTTEITLKLDSERAIQFAHHLMDTTGGSYTSDSLFFDNYKGLYFARKAGQNPASALYRIVLSGMEMTLYTHSFTDASATQVKDTIQTYYAFGNSSSLYYNSHANRITHDYTGTPIQRINDTLPASEPMEFGY